MIFFRGDARKVKNGHAVTSGTGEGWRWGDHCKVTMNMNGVRGQGFGSNSGQNSGTDQKLKGEDKY